MPKHSKPACVLGILIVLPQNGLADTRPCEPIKALIEHLSATTKPLHLNPQNFVERRRSLPAVDAKLLRLYKKDLIQFGAKIADADKDRKVETVFYPLGGFDVTPLLLFPQSKNLIIVDYGGPFLVPKYLALSPWSYGKETGILEHGRDRNQINYLNRLNTLLKSHKSQNLPDEHFRPLFKIYDRGVGHISPSLNLLNKMGMLPLFLGRLRTYFPMIRIHEVIAFTTERLAPIIYSDEARCTQCHGLLRFDTGEGTPHRTLVYINGLVDITGLLAQAGLPDENIVLFKDRISDSRLLVDYLPLETLANIDAMVVRGAMHMLRLPGPGGPDTSLYPRSPGLYFFKLLQARNGILVEGQYSGAWLETHLQCYSWEMLPDLLEDDYISVDALTVVNPALKFSYGEGIRALFLENE